MRLKCPKFCAKIFCCLRMDKKKRILAQNYNQLEKEIQVSYILKQLRVVKNVAKETMSPSEWRRAFAKYSLISYMTSDPENESMAECEDKVDFLKSPREIDGENDAKKKEGLS